MIQPMIEQSYFTRRTLRLISITALALGVFVFIGYELRALQAPALDLISPTGDITIHETSFDITGRTNPDADVTVNGRPVFSGATGVFSERVELFQGVNEVLVIAKNRYGRATSESRYIIVE